MLQGGKSEKNIACCNTQIPEVAIKKRKMSVAMVWKTPYPSVCKEFRKLFHFFKTDLVSAICV